MSLTLKTGNLGPWMPDPEEACLAGYREWVTVNPDGSHDKRTLQLNGERKEWGEPVRIKEPRE